MSPPPAEPSNEIPTLVQVSNEQTEAFGPDDKIVRKTMAYEASEYLGEHLDDRFSAKSMSRFLVLHLDRKSVEARKLVRSEKDVERMTASTTAARTT